MLATSALRPAEPVRVSSCEDWERAEALARRVMAGSSDWPALWVLVSPHIERWVESPTFLGRLARDEDHRREIVVQAWEKLQDRDHGKLRAFFDRPRDSEVSPGRRFRAWVRRVVRNLGIDYMRTLPEYNRKRPNATPAAPLATGERPPSHGYWRSIVSITSQAGALPDDTTGRAEAQRMLEFLDHEISTRRRRAVELADQGVAPRAIARELGLRDAAEAERIVARARERLKFRAALELWSHGYTDAEIAAELGLDGAAAAERMVKAAKELLRRNFRT